MYETKWTEIKAWSDLTEIPLKGHEAAAVMRMSHAYTSAVHTYSGKELPPPWHNDNADQKAIADATKKAFRR